LLMTRELFHSGMKSQTRSHVRANFHQVSMPHPHEYGHADSDSVAELVKARLNPSTERLLPRSHERSHTA